MRVILKLNKDSVFFWYKGFQGPKTYLRLFDSKFLPVIMYENFDWLTCDDITTMGWSTVVRETDVEVCIFSCHLYFLLVFKVSLVCCVWSKYQLNIMTYEVFFKQLFITGAEQNARVVYLSYEFFRDCRPFIRIDLLFSWLMCTKMIFNWL